MTEEEIVQTSRQVEPSVSTMLMNFSNDFDPYEALSTPLYQTATFKQVNSCYNILRSFWKINHIKALVCFAIDSVFRQPSATDSGAYDYTRSGNPTRDALERS